MGLITLTWFNLISYMLIAFTFGLAVGKLLFKNK